MDPKILHEGDPCPACGGVLEPAAVPTDAEYARSLDRENPIVLQPGADTASPAVRADLGALHRCGRCGYQARFKAAAGAEGGEPGALSDGPERAEKSTRRGSR